MFWNVNCSKERNGEETLTTKQTLQTFFLFSLKDIRYFQKDTTACCCENRDVETVNCDNEHFTS